MRLSILSSLLAIATLVTPALAADPLRDQATELFQPIPKEPPALPGNAATPAKLDLGRMLYFDPRLSQSHNISCNTCHLVGMGGVDGRPTSVGHNWQHGGRNAPTVLNAVFNTAQFWDGRAADLKEQAGGPIATRSRWASPRSTRSASSRASRATSSASRRVPRRGGPDHLRQHRGASRCSRRR